MQDNAFAALGLDARIVNALSQQNIAQPTPVQAEGVPILVSGRDLIASAQTGTGKTAAFLLPALQRLIEAPAKPGRGPRVLVLTPTRELAQQVARSAELFSKGLSRIRTISLIGGVSFRIQNELLSKPVEILVATPGRLIDQMNSGRIDFGRLEMLILDEADRMLDMGFSDDVLEIARKLPKERLTAFFTATMTRNVKDFADQLLNDPATIEIAPQTAKHENITQQLIYADDVGHKRRLTQHLLAQDDVKQAIVFVATKRDCDTLADELAVAGIPADSLHGDMQQRDRQRTLTKLRNGTIQVLVATDVAARGIDVAGISHVLNFDLPRFAEDYVHRIGRTGRAGATGTAVSLVGRDDVMPLRRIERFTNHKIDIIEIPGMEARHKPQERGFGGKGGAGGRRPHGGGGFGAKRFEDRRPGGGHRHGNGFGSDRRQADGAAAPRSYGDRPAYGDRQPRSQSGDNRGNSWGNDNRGSRFDDNRGNNWSNDSRSSRSDDNRGNSWGGGSNDSRGNRGYGDRRPSGGFGGNRGRGGRGDY